HAHRGPGQRAWRGAQPRLLPRRGRAEGVVGGARRGAHERDHGAPRRVRAARRRVLRPGPPAMRRHTDREAVLFTAAAAVGVVHALDDAVVHRGPGVGAGEFALTALVAVVAWLAASAAFPRLRPGLRAAL